MERRGTGEPSKLHLCGHQQLLQQSCPQMLIPSDGAAQSAPVPCIYSQRLELLLWGDWPSGVPGAALRDWAALHLTIYSIRADSDFCLPLVPSWGLVSTLSG